MNNLLVFLVLLGWVLWHINHCRLFNAKSCFYTHKHTHIYIYIYIYIRGAFNKFPVFFVQAFKIVVDSLKFSMLLLYIL